jgi:hypothetical protein
VPSHPRTSDIANSQRGRVCLLMANIPIEAHEIVPVADPCIEFQVIPDCSVDLLN